MVSLKNRYGSYPKILPFDFSNIDYDNTPAAQKGWCSVEVNKVKKLTVNNNMFKNRVNAQPFNKHSHSYHVQCWGVPREVEDSWELVVTNNKFILESAHPHINGHPSGGVIIVNGSGSSEKVGVFPMDQVVLLPFQSLSRLLIIIVLKIWIMVLLLLLGINLNPVTTVNQAMLMVVQAKDMFQTTGVTFFGGEVTDGAAYSHPHRHRFCRTQ